MLSIDPHSSPLYSSSHPGFSTMPSFHQPRLLHKHLFIVTGPAGCGKTTVAKHLANAFDLPYLEGDDYHPRSNVEKMAAGIALTDEDRWDWLVQLREEAVDALDRGAHGVVLTCSALKKKYRDVIRIARYNDHDVMVHFIYLRASEELLIQRVLGRKGHFMKSSMIRSQLQCLEEPQKGKEKDVISMDVSGSQQTVKKMAVEAVMGVLAADVYPPNTA